MCRRVQAKIAPLPSVRRASHCRNNFQALQYKSQFYKFGRTQEPEPRTISNAQTYPDKRSHSLWGVAAGPLMGLAVVEVVMVFDSGEGMIS